MVQRLAVIGFIVAVIIAVFAFTQQQQAVNQAAVAQTAQARAENAQVTAAALAQDASGTQVGAEAALATAQRQAAQAGTALAEANIERSTAVAQAQVAGTSEASMLSTAAVESTGIAALATRGIETASALYSEQAETLAAAQADAAEFATAQVEIVSLLGTATAQVDLAAFAQEAAEEDRATAVAQARAAETQLAAMRSDVATAQFFLTGLPPSTPAPTLAETAIIPEATAIIEESTPEVTDPALTQTFTSNEGLLSFRYPADWLVGQLPSGVVFIASSEATASRTTNALAPGQFDTSLFIVSGADLTGQAGTTTVVDVLTGLATFLTEQSATTTFNAVRNITLGQRSVARTDGSNGTNDVLLLVIELGDDAFLVAFASSAVGEMTEFEPILRSIITTVVYNTP